MSAKTGTCVSDQRRAVGTFNGKAQCNTHRPRTEAWRKMRAVKIEKAEQEAARVAAAEQTRLEEAKAKEEPCRKHEKCDMEPCTYEGKEDGDDE